MEQRKHKKIVCIIIALFLLIAGMGLEPVQAHSSFPGSISETETTKLISHTKMLTDIQGCTLEMLGIHNISNSQNAVVDNTFKQRGMSLSFAFFLLSFPCPTERKIFTGIEEICLYNRFPKELVVHYIHKSDGRKRTI